MKNNKLLGFLGVLAGVSVVKADPVDVSTVTTSVGAITGSASTAYIAAAGLGVALLTVSIIVYMSKRGWKLR